MFVTTIKNKMDRFGTQWTDLGQNGQVWETKWPALKNRHFQNKMDIFRTKWTDLGQNGQVWEAKWPAQKNRHFQNKMDSFWTILGQKWTV